MLQDCLRRNSVIETRTKYTFIEANLEDFGG